MSAVLSQLGIDPKILLLQAIGFLILFLLLRAYLFGPVGKILQAREQEIAGNLAQAAQERTKAEELRSDYEGHLAVIREEARTEMQRAVREGQAERERLIAEARTEREELLHRAATEIELEKRKALIELRQQTADLALAAATRALRTSLDEAAQRRAIDQFITELGSTPETHP